MTRRPFRPVVLVPGTASHETIECLRRLFDDATAGKVIGIAYVAMYQGRTFVAHACGEAHRSPVFTRGMLRSLDEQLGEIIRDGS